MYCKKKKIDICKKNHLKMNEKKKKEKKWKTGGKYQQTPT